MSEKKMFPIQRDNPIPWALAERAYRTYRRLYGGGQTIERMAERGGFGIKEFACLLAGHDPSDNHPACEAAADVARSEANGAIFIERELRKTIADRDAQIVKLTDALTLALAMVRADDEGGAEVVMADALGVP